MSRFWFLAARAFLALALVVTVVGFIGSFVPSNDRLPVFQKGREEDFLVLLTPYRLGDEVSDGFRLWSVVLEPPRVEIVLRDASDRDVRFVLAPPTQADVRDGSVPEAVRSALTQAFERNKVHRASHRSLSVFAAMSRDLRAGFALAKDGLVQSLAVVLLAIVLALHVLVGAPRFIRLGLPLVVGVGVALRLTLAPVGYLGAWPWGRLWPHAETIWKSDVFAGLTSAYAQEVYLTDLSLWVNFGYACLTPLVVFAHASLLLRDSRAGLAAAAIIAFSPHHIRFSHSEVAFIPSLLLSSLAFALIHVFMRDPSIFWRWFALSTLPFVLWPSYLLRPLNIVYVAVFLGAVLLLDSDHSPLRRRVIVGFVVCGVWLGAFVTFLSFHRDQVVDATTDVGWLLKIPFNILNPTLNMLLNPFATAPALLVATILGVRWLRDSGQRRVLVFLLLWIAVFFVLHLYVSEPAMQPRYHLHLLIPFALLASLAVVEACRRWPRHWLAIAGASVALAPLFSIAWIRDVGYSDTLEYPFVREARDLVPEGCTVVEYSDVDRVHGWDSQRRFARIAERLVDGEHRPRFSTMFVKTRRPDDAVMLDPSIKNVLSASAEACVYVYEGLTCSGSKRTDEEYAPECVAMATAAPMETVLERWIPVRRFDFHVTKGVTPGTTRIRLALSRVLPRTQGVDAAEAVTEIVH